jgi:hypothetical protein
VVSFFMKMSWQCLLVTQRRHRWQGTTFCAQFKKASKIDGPGTKDPGRVTASDTLGVAERSIKQPALELGGLLDRASCPLAASRGSDLGANGKLAPLTVAIPTATVVRTFTNLRFGKVKFVYAVADSAHHSRRPFRRHVTEIVTAHLKTALKRSPRFGAREN